MTSSAAARRRRTPVRPRARSGRRVVVGQCRLQAVSDIFLGFVRVSGIDGVTRDFCVRQLRDWKGSARVELLRPEGMLAYAHQNGRDDQALVEAIAASRIPAGVGV